MPHSNWQTDSSYGMKLNPEELTVVLDREQEASTSKDVLNVNVIFSWLHTCKWT